MASSDVKEVDQRLGDNFLGLFSLRLIQVSEVSSSVFSVPSISSESSVVPIISVVTWIVGDLVRVLEVSLFHNLLHSLNK